MIERLNDLLEQAEKLTSDAEARQAAIALMRITLQHACIALAEWLVETRVSSSILVPDRTPLPLTRLRIPSDGTLASVLAELLVAAENDGWNGVSRPFWQSTPSPRPCCRIAANIDVNLEQVLRSYVEIRNEGVEGHGIPGDFDREAELDAVRFAIEALSHILPTLDKITDNLVIQTSDGSPYALQLLRTVGGDLLCYRKIQRAAGGKCIVRAQRQIDLFDREQVVYEAHDILGTPKTGSYPQYRPWSTYDEEWCPFTLIPDPLTEHFTGRENELRDLQDWADDFDSRACMLFGEGGIGKTTLAVEFLHRMLHGDIRTQWRPDLITFYTAKQTRWGLKGLEIIRVHQVGIADVAVDIVRALEGETLDRSWFNRDPEALIQKLAGYLRDWGVDRDSHLLVLDNSETMATSDDAVQALSRHIRELSRKVGRVLLTSRRREAIEARQIEIKPFDVEDSVRFLRARAEALNQKQIMQAGIPTLRKFSRRLGNKPLVLEVFIQALGQEGISLSRAFDRVLRMQRQDLGEFLYTDAWSRMNDRMKHLLLLMTRVGDSHDELLLKLCCLQVGITVIEANEALEDSRGIATTSRIDDHLQIAFSRAFMNYCKDRTIKITGRTCPTANSVDTVSRRYRDFLKSRSAQIRDRVSRAYRHHLARAAWLAYKEGRPNDCELFYEEAIIADSQNGWLFDRYAYFLFMQKRFPEALEKSKMATKLIAEDPDAWFTRGMIEARLGKTEEATDSLERARELGKPKHLCLLQQAYAYLNDTPPNKAKARVALLESEAVTPTDDGYRWKHLEELSRVRRRVASPRAASYWL